MNDINQLAKEYAEGKLNYAEYKKLRTQLLNNIVSGKIKLSDNINADTDDNNPKQFSANQPD